METKKRSIWELLGGILLILLSIAAYSSGFFALVWISWGLVIALLVKGIGLISTYSAIKGVKNAGFILTMGIIDVLASILIMSNFAQFTAQLPILVGLLLIINSIMKFVMAVSTDGLPNKGMAITISILGVLLGFFFTNHYFATLFSMAIMTGTSFLIYGITLIADYFSSEK